MRSWVAAGSPSGRLLADGPHVQQELKVILERGVDLLTRRGVERGHNAIRRQAFLDGAEPVYVAR
jgi:uncharacterized protein